MFVRTIHISLAVLIGLLMASTAHAATISFSGAEQYNVGDTITVSVVISTASSETANAVSAKVTFPADLLTIVSVTKDGSVINFWPEEPEYSSTPGSAQFEGVILNPGWKGSRGTVVNLVFKAKAAGTVNLKFSDSSILANDGKGTNILTSSPAKNISIAAVSVAPVAEGTPKITSSTFPNQNNWYKSRQGTFSWTLPSDVVSVRTSFDTQANGVPLVESSPPISETKITVLSDGIYYFHVQFKKGDGWGPIGHYKFQVDTLPPAVPDIRLAHPDLTTDPRPILLFNTIDGLSGIDHYEVKIDSEGFLTFRPETTKSNPYAPAWLGPGKKEVVVIAYDKAGNSVTTTKSITIEEIDTPIVTEYPSELNEGDLLRIRGKTYPGATVTVYLKDPQGIVTSDTSPGNSLGVFGLVWTKTLQPGLYSFTVTAIDDKGGLSHPTEPLFIRVKGSRTLSNLNLHGWLIWGILMLVVFGLLSVVLYLILKRKLPKFISKHINQNWCEQDEIEFREQLLEEKKLLEKAKTERGLTKEEEIILEDIRVRIRTIKRKLDDSSGRS